MLVLANVLQPLIDVVESVLVFFHDTAGFSWGASIIAMTVVVRLAILPLTFRQIRSMQALQRLQPEMKKIQERFKDDRQRMNQEMMAFYRDHKVNPLGSCLPLLLQIPFFISIFYLLRDDSFKQDIRGEEAFLFIKDLAAPATGGVLAVLIVLYVLTQLGASLVSTATMTDKTQKRLFLALPFVFVFFILSFEAGLIVYWITTNLWTVGQQLAVRKLMPTPEPLISSSVGGGGSGTRAEKGDRSRATAKAGGARAKAAATAGKGAGGASGNGGPQKAPPPSPRRKKKRSGRRR